MTTERRNRRQRNSIDIFDESFDESPKQNIGSNKNFKQLTEDDLKNNNFGRKSKNKNESKKGRFSFNLFNRSSNKNESKETNKNNKSTIKKSKDKKETNNSNDKPRFRPKR